MNREELEKISKNLDFLGKKILEKSVKEIDNIFKDKYDASLVKTIHKFVNRKFKDTSISLEKEIQAATSTLI